jgi:rhomboid protease GluP
MMEKQKSIYGMSDKRPARSSIPMVNYALIAVNVLVFLAGTAAAGGGMTGEMLYARGALYAPLILKGQGFYRLLTAVFLHADPAHLVNNMIVQLAAGTILEKRIGHIRYAVVYVLSGLAGNLVSVGADWMSGSYGYSVGASGAVFGVLGALIFLITRMTVRSLRRQKHSSVWYQGGGAGSGDRAGRKYRSLLLRTGIMTAYLVYSGWSNPVINQAAHIGGLVCGFILCAVLMMTRPDVDLNELLQ